MILLQSDYQDPAWEDLPEERRDRIVDVIGRGVREFTIIDIHAERLILVTAQAMKGDDNRVVIRGDEIVHVVRVRWMNEDEYTNDMVALRNNQSSPSARWNGPVTFERRPG